MRHWQDEGSTISLKHLHFSFFVSWTLTLGGEEEGHGGGDEGSLGEHGGRRREEVAVEGKYVWA